MAEFTNGLNKAEAERLAVLAEECGEVIQVVGKILRHGYESYSPNDTQKITNREWLEKEIGDIFVIGGILVASGDIDHNQMMQHTAEKLGRISKYLHHQTPMAPPKPEQGTPFDENLPPGFDKGNN